MGQGAYQAEFGRASGGSVNMVLRSGGNTLHGDGFYYYRDQSFAARDPLASIKPPERRQQLGGSLSGPIRSNKLFYFVNYDQQIRNFPLVIEDLTGALTSGKPTLPANPTAAQQAQYNTDLTAFNAGVAFVLKQFPGGAPGNLQSRTMGNNIALGKVDYLINNSNTLSTFFNYMRSHGDRAIQTPIVLGNVGRNGTDDVRIDSYNARLTTTFGSATGQRAALPVEPRFRIRDRRRAAAGDLRQRQRQLLFRPGHVPAAVRAAGRAAHAVRGQLLLHHGASRLQVRRRSQPRQRLHQQPDAVRRHLYVCEHARAGPRPGHARREKLHQLRAGLRPGEVRLQHHRFRAVRAGPVEAGFARSPSTTDCAGTRRRCRRRSRRIRPSRRPSTSPPIGTASGRASGWPRTCPARAAPCCAAATACITGAFPTASSPTRCRIPGLHGSFESPGGADPAAHRCQRSGVPQRSAVGAHQRESQHHGHAPGRQLQPAARAGLSLSASSSSCRGAWCSAPATPRHMAIIWRSWWTAICPRPQFQRTYQLPDGTTFQVPFSAGVIKTAAGATVSVNAARPDPTQGAINTNTSQGKSWYNGLLVDLRRRIAKGVQVNGAFTWAKAENTGGQRQRRRFRGGDSIQRRHPGRPVQLRQ